MVQLEWRLTLLVLLVVPVFLLPARRVGRKMQKLTRESFQLDAAMNATMTERFNVSGALLVKLFGHPRRESAEFAEQAGRVRDIGIRTAMYGRLFFSALALLGRRRHRRRLLAGHPPGDRRAPSPSARSPPWPSTSPASTPR